MPSEQKVPVAKLVIIYANGYCSFWKWPANTSWNGFFYPESQIFRMNAVLAGLYMAMLCEQVSNKSHAI